MEKSLKWDDGPDSCLVFSRSEEASDDCLDFFGAMVYLCLRLLISQNVLVSSDLFKAVVSKDYAFCVQYLCSYPILPRRIP